MNKESSLLRCSRVVSAATAPKLLLTTTFHATNIMNLAFQGQMVKNYGFWYWKKLGRRSMVVIIESLVEILILLWETCLVHHPITTDAVITTTSGPSFPMPHNKDISFAAAPTTTHQKTWRSTALHQATRMVFLIALRSLIKTDKMWNFSISEIHGVLSNGMVTGVINQTSGRLSWSNRLISKKTVMMAYSGYHLMISKITLIHSKSADSTKHSNSLISQKMKKTQTIIYLRSIFQKMVFKLFQFLYKIKDFSVQRWITSILLLEFMLLDAWMAKIDQEVSSTSIASFTDGNETTTSNSKTQSKVFTWFMLRSIGMTRSTNMIGSSTSPITAQEVQASRMWQDKKARQCFSKSSLLPSFKRLRMGCRLLILKSKVHQKLRSIFATRTVKSKGISTGFSRTKMIGARNTMRWWSSQCSTTLRCYHPKLVQSLKWQFILVPMRSCWWKQLRVHNMIMAIKREPSSSPMKHSNNTPSTRTSSPSEVVQTSASTKHGTIKDSWLSMSTRRRIRDSRKRFNIHWADWQLRILVIELG